MARRHLPVIPEDFKDPGLPDGVFSHTQYSLYKNCPKAYEFRYVKGLKRPPSGVQFKGQVVHYGAETAHLTLIENKVQPDLREVVARVSDMFDREREAVQDWEDETPGQAKDQVLAAYAAYHRKALPRVRPVSAEKHFLKRVGTVPMQGYIDLIDHAQLAPGAAVPGDPGRLVVADLKYTSRTKSQAEVDKNTQLTLYSLVEGIPTVRIDNVVSLKAGPEVKHLDSLRDAQAQRILVDDIEETAFLVKEGVFPKTAIDSWMCSEKWCGYWSMCRGKRT